MSSSNGSRTWPGFWSGVVLTLTVILAVRVSKHVYEWLASNPTAAEIVAWLTKPIFSIGDVVTFLLGVLLVYVIAWMAAFGPRVSH